jgi:creatinine amidohydrolase
LTFEAIRQRAESGWLALIPTGCTEQQGPHLPVDFDTWFVESVCSAVAERAQAAWGVEALVLPALPFGPTPEHRGFGSGYVDLPQSLHEAVVASVLQSLAQQGFRRLVVWRGCGQHDLSRPVESFNRDYHGRARAFQPELPYPSIWRAIGDPAVPGGHADSFATSIALHLRPGAVRMGEIRNPHSQPVPWDDPDLDLARYSSTGVIGDPTQASADLGARLWEAVVQEVALILRAAAETPLQ